MSRLTCFAGLLLCFAILSPACSEEVPVIIPTSALNPTSPWVMSVQPTFGGDSEQILGSIMTVRQSFEVVPLNIRYRSSHRDTLRLEIPYIYRSQELRLNGDSAKLTDSGLGDINFGFERSLRRSKLSGWNGVLGLSLQAPTGRSVYSDLGADQLPMGTGHYQTGIDLRLRRTADPLVTDFGFGVGYSVPRTHDGVVVKPGFGFTLMSGIGYALNDRWVLIEQMEYLRQPNVLLQNAATMQTETLDQAYITHGLIYNPSNGGKSYSLRFSLGLNNASTAYMVTFEIQ